MSSHKCILQQTALFHQAMSSTIVLMLFTLSRFDRCCNARRVFSPICVIVDYLQQSYVHPAGSDTDRQDFAAFVTRAHATKGILSCVLAMLSATQPQSLLLIVLKRSNQNEAEQCFAPDPLLSITPGQIAQPVQHVVRELQTTTAVPTVV